MAVDFKRQERVVRLLNLLAYASNHPGLTPMEIARDLGADPMHCLLYTSPSPRD